MNLVSSWVLWLGKWCVSEVLERAGPSNPCSSQLCQCAASQLLWAPSRDTGLRSISEKLYLLLIDEWQSTNIGYLTNLQTAHIYFILQKKKPLVLWTLKVMKPGFLWICLSVGWLFTWIIIIFFVTTAYTEHLLLWRILAATCRLPLSEMGICRNLLTR